MIVAKIPIALKMTGRGLGEMVYYLKVSACSWLAGVQFYETNETDLSLALLTATRRGGGA